MAETYYAHEQSLPLVVQARLSRAIDAAAEHFGLTDAERAWAEESALQCPWPALECYEALARSLVPR